jgi:hypothetical protein
MTSDPNGDPRDREVSLTITRDPSLVRTVRLVAASLARRAGLDASAVEEVRLAVGETCAVLVGASDDVDGSNGTGGASGTQVTVTMRVDGGLVAEIDGPTVVASDVVDEAPSDLPELALDPWVLVRGLREDVEVAEDGGTTHVRLSWSA